ncbi:terminase small subunit [Ferrimonas balearica]|uniref:terminase small subunit n=1 Tax=Ferrimonas balearica TaxID=44012 RepID=UPI001C98A6C9|nr:terminase small subunit [Ferrimonas balearica]MBY6104897.1 terminase small subunit [Ferrimonas balearica]
MSKAKSIAAPEPHWLNKSQMAASLGISVQAFDKWGVEPCGKIGRSVYFDARSVVDNRLANQSAKHQPTSVDDLEEGSIDYERWRLTKAQADKVEMENEIARHEVVPVDFATYALARIAAGLVGILDTLPLNLQRRDPSLTTTSLENLQRELAKARNECSRLGETLPEVLDDYLNQAEG